MRNNSEITSRSRTSRIEIIHSDHDPAIWIVRRWRKFLVGKRLVSSDWFTEEKQARTFAESLRDGG